MLRNPDTIVVDYYQGSYGPTIRIEIHSMDELRRIRNMVSNLKDGKIEEIRIRNWEHFEITGLYDLIMRIEPRKRHYYQNIRKIRDASVGPVFLWTQTADDWEHREGLIDGLIKSSRSGHQYLTGEGDGVLIELAYIRQK